MITITHFAHPSDIDAAEMFVLRAESRLWADNLRYKVGDTDMSQSAELLFSRGMHPRYKRQLHLVASDVDVPTRQEDVLGVASLELPMMDNPRLATLGVVVRKDRREEGIGSALHAASLELARKHGRSSIQGWTWEPPTIPAGALDLAAEIGDRGVEANSDESRFLTRHGYVLGQVERVSRLEILEFAEAQARRDDALKNKGQDYEVITIRNGVPQRLFAGIAELVTAYASDKPSGSMDLEDELWDAERVGDSMKQVEVGNREQLFTVVRHVPSDKMVAFTRFLRDRSLLEVAHQFETLVLEEHRGRGLGMLMKLVNHAAVGEFWPEAQRLVTGESSESLLVRSINDALGFESYGANGYWELRLRGTDS